MQELIDNRNIDNIIEKLNVYMKRNNQTMHGLATAMGFAYQPFYRLMTKKSLPAFNSLNSIAQNLNCTMSELINDNIFLDTNCYDSFESYLSASKPSTIRIYLPCKALEPRLNEKFFCVRTDIIDKRLNYIINNINFTVNTNIYQIFTVNNKIDIDGFFLVKYKKEIIILEVLSISSMIIIAKYEDRVIEIPSADLEAYAKFFSFLELSNKNQLTLRGQYK